MTYRFCTIESAVQEIRKGKLVIVMDARDREYEGDFIGAASMVTADKINFILSYARGAFVAVFTPPGLCDRLQIPPMTQGADTSFNQTKFRLAIDAVSAVSGSSAYDRALVVQRLGDPAARPEDFVRPGHVVPIEAHPQGLLARRGHTEAGVELMKLAGIDPPVALDLEILDDDGRMAREERLFDLANRFKLSIINIGDLIEHVKKNQSRELRLES